MAINYLNATEKTRHSLPVASATVIEKGDLLYRDSGNNDVRPASSQADNVGEEANQAEFAANFIGVACQSSASGDTDPILVETSLTHEYKVTVPSGTYRFGSLLAASEATSGTALEDQQLEATTSRDIAIFMVTDDDSSTRTSVRCRPIRSVFQPEVPYNFQASRSTAAGAVTLTHDSVQVQSIDPGGAARDLFLPADEESSGKFFFIINRADMAEAITVKDDGSATIVAIAQNEMGLVVHDGTAWFGGTWTQT